MSDSSRQVTRKAAGRNSGEVQTINELLYRLTGLLVLQSLYSEVIKENKLLKAHLAKKDTKKPPTTGHDPGAASALDSQEESHSSVMSQLNRGMQLKISRYEQIMSSAEGKDAKGLIKQNHELRLSHQHEMEARMELESELQSYKQLESASTGSAVSLIDHTTAKQLAKSAKLATVQRTLVDELGKQLEQSTREEDRLCHQLDSERYGRKLAEEELGNLMGDFVQCCARMPGVSTNQRLKEALEEMRLKAKKISQFGMEISAAIEIAAEYSGAECSLDEAPDSQQENTRMSLPQALKKVEELQDKERRVKISSRKQVIDHMRKHKQALMLVKDLRERFEKCEADKRLTVEQMGGGIERATAKLSALEQTLGRRSSYANKAAQSVRSLVELIEEQKMGLERERNELSSQVAILKLGHDELKSRNEQISAEITRIASTALEEATAKVRGDLEELGSQCGQLANERSSLKERLDSLQEETQKECQAVVTRMNSLQESAKSDREDRRTAIENVERLEQEVRSSKREVRESKAANRLLTARIATLERSSQNVPSDHLSLQRPLGEADYSHPSSEFNLREDFATQSQSLPPAHGAYGQSVYPSSLNPNHRDEIGHYVAGSLQPQSLQGPRAARPAAKGERPRQSSLFSRPTPRNNMKCLKCGALYPITNLSGYEQHIKDCYSDSLHYSEELA